MADWQATLEVAGLARDYLGHTPDGGGRQAMPLVLVLHGRLGTPLGMRRLSAFDALANREHFVVVYPAGISRSWNDTPGTTPAAVAGVDDVAFIRGIVEQQLATGTVDRDRIFAVGMSNGAMMCHRLAIELSELLAGIGAVAGLLPRYLANGAPPAHAVSVAQVHGTDDRLVPFAGGAVKSRGAGREVLSVADTAAWWRTADGCSAELNRREHTTAVSVIGSSPGTGGTAVETWMVSGGGHTWPGAARGLLPRLFGNTSAGFSAAEVIWRHLAAHAAPAAQRRRGALADSSTIAP